MAYVRINGMDLYSEVDGRGSPVLLLHGGFCSLESLRAQSDALVTDHQVFAFERPGHGRSADIDGEYSYARYVADTLEYLDAQGLESVDVIGYSDGAIIGLLLAIETPGASPVVGRDQREPGPVRVHGLGRDCRCSRPGLAGTGHGRGR